MVVKYSKWPKYITTFSIPRSSKIYPNWDFWSEKITSGNPASQRTELNALCIVTDGNGMMAVRQTNLAYIYTYATDTHSMIWQFVCIVAWWHLNPRTNQECGSMVHDAVRHSSAEPTLSIRWRQPRLKQDTYIYAMQQRSWRPLYMQVDAGPS
jgi:hypothetical protein